MDVKTRGQELRELACKWIEAEQRKKDAAKAIDIATSTIEKQSREMEVVRSKFKEYLGNNLHRRAVILDKKTVLMIEKGGLNGQFNVMVTILEAEE